jgi:DNA polymerase IV
LSLLVSQRARAQFELRKLKLSADEAASPERGPEKEDSPRAKRRKISSTEDYALRSSSFEDSDNEHTQRQEPSTAATRKVVRLGWLQDSLLKGSLVDYKDYLVYSAVRSPLALPAPELSQAVESHTPVRLPYGPQPSATESLASSTSSSLYRRPMHRQARPHKTPHLLAQSTSEEKAIANLPPVPDYLHTSYSCQRATVVHPPNEAFIEKLKEVRQIRSIRGDPVGIRAYSTAIASLSAYPHHLQTPAGTSLHFGHYSYCGR